MHLMLPLLPLIVNTLHAILLTLLFHYKIPHGKVIYKEAEQVGSLVLGSFLVWEVGSLLILGHQQVFKLLIFTLLAYLLPV